MRTDKPVVLVTGAGGQLGQTLKKYYGNLGKYNMVYVSSSDLDITDTDQVLGVFEKYHPNFCINCAAYTDVRGAEKEPEKAYAINAEAAGNLARLCADHKCTLIHISTDYVFDGQKGAPYTPEDIPAPINVYGSSKLKGEEKIRKNTSAFYIVRTSWLYSKEFGKNFYRTILNNARENKPMNIITSQQGTPTNTVNLATYLVSLLEEKEPYGIKHFSDGKVMTWYDLAVSILKEHNLDLSLLTPVEDIGKEEVRRPLYSALAAGNS